MSARQVYIIWAHPLFHESMRLLLDHPQIQFVGETSDYLAAQEELVRLRPDILLMEDDNGEEHARIMEYFQACPWSMMIFLISMDDNELGIYHHEKRAVVRTNDLLSWVLQ